MKKMILLFVLILPWYSHADYMDVIQGELKENCDYDKYMAIVNDFRDKWAKDHDYRVDVLWPAYSDNLTHIFWVARSASAASFGKAFDSWTNSLGDPKSLAAKLSKRFGDCSTNISRRSYSTH